MNPLDTSIMAALIAGLTGSGLSSLIMFLIQRHDKKKECKNSEVEKQSAMLVGLGHDRIVYLGSKYIKAGNITHQDYEDLIKYLYEPYQALGGNGTAQKIMQEVDKLPFREEIES